jgi:tetratricopeptide (TPR) repeat protein
MTQIKRALEGDPLNLTFNTSLASGYAETRRYDLALDQFKKTFEIDANYASAHDNLARTYLNMGKYDLWLEEWKKSATLANDREELAIAEEAARVYKNGGFRAAVSHIIELRKELAQRRYVDPSDIAYAYALLGDKEQVFYWLDKAYSDKAGGLQVIKGSADGSFPPGALHRPAETNRPAAVIDLFPALERRRPTPTSPS